MMVLSRAGLHVVVMLVGSEAPTIFVHTAIPRRSNSSEDEVNVLNSRRIQPSPGDIGGVAAFGPSLHPVVATSRLPCVGVVLNVALFVFPVAVPKTL
ncbi:MAG: hypothetical protein LAT57_05310 [Balneolales bacterium]|nr:hypothetical protein [Balneolales bacterium]